METNHSADHEITIETIQYQNFINILTTAKRWWFSSYKGRSEGFRTEGTEFKEIWISKIPKSMFELPKSLCMKKIIIFLVLN